MTVQCITCARLSLGNATDRPPEGCGICPLRRRGEYVTLEFARACPGHKPTDEATVAQRRWEALDGPRQRSTT